MKTLIHSIAAIAALLLSQMYSLAADPPPKDTDFDAGIGFYIRKDGQFYALSWPVPKDKIANTDNVILIKPNDSLFSYGLDFSTPTMVGPLPPHLIGYRWGYIRPDGRQEGEWALRFHPIQGLKERTYEIYLDSPIADLMNGKIQHKQFYITVTPEKDAYVFRFKELPTGVEGKPTK